MGNPMSQASKRTAVIAILPDVAVVLGTLLSVAALSLGDLMEIIPLFAPLVASPFFPFFHETHDLLAVAVALYATYKYHVRLGVVAILLFLIAHIPYIIAEFTEGAPEILRILFGVFIALLGIWLINQLQKSQEQMEVHSKEARKERRFSQNIIATIPESLLVLDKNLRIKSANRSFYQLFQTKSENTIGRKLPDVLWDEGSKLATELSRLFGTEDTLDNFELRYQSEKLGEKIFYITARGIIVAEEEEEEEEEVVIRDITERKQAEEALMRTEENFRRSLEDSPLGVRIVNEDGETVYANRAMLDIYGYTGIGELKATSASERYTPDSYVEHQVRKEKRQRGEYVPSNYEISIVRKDGEIRHLEVFRKEVLWNGHTQFQVLYNDATERKRAVEKLRESEEKYRSLFANMMNGLAYCKMIFDEDKQPVDFTYVEVNDSFERLTGLRKDDVVGKRVTEVIPSIKTLNPEIITIYGQVVLTGKPTAFEVFFKPLNIWLAIWVYSPREGYLVAVFDNITESKQAEKVLEESEARYRSLVHLGAEVGEAIVMLQDEGGREGLQAFCNEAWPRITGYSSKELLNMSFFDLLYPKDREASLLRHRRKMRGEGVPGLYEVTIIRKDGSEVCVELTSARSTYQGKPTNVAYIRDVTERKAAEESLRKSEERLKATVMNAPIGIATSGMDRYFLSANDAFCGILGYTEAELQKMSFKDITHPEDIKESVARIDDIDAGKITSFSQEKHYIKKDGKVIIGKVMVSAVRDHEGRPYLYIAELEDITESKQAEETLKKSEERLKEAQALGRIGSWEFDIEKQAITWSDETYVLYERELKLGPPSPEEEARYYSPEQAKMLRDYAARAIETGQMFSYDLEVMLPSGKRAYYHAVMQPVKVPGGRVIKLTGTVQDITEHMQAEAEIRRLLDRESHAAREWQETFDAVTDIVTLISPRHELLRINRAGCKAMGKKPEELIGKKCYEVVHGLSTPLKQCPCVEALETKKSHTSELTERGRHYLLAAYPIFDEGGGIVAFAHIIEDITERKQAEEERLELERKAQNASRLASIGEMAAGIAHEINNPLTPILGFTEMLMKRDLPEDAKSDLKIIYDSTRRTADVTRRLLTFARQSKPMRVLCNINEVVESTLQLRAYQLKTNSIKVITEFTSELPRTMADAGQLQQVLLNLIMNAEYEMTQSHGGGNIQIKTEKLVNIIRVSIKDDGPGISRENMEKLFTPFFTTKKVGEGTGLGLSVCHGIIAEHNGRIYAESKVGKGATFVVELPIVRQQKEKETKPSESDTVVPREAVKAKILVVDDEPTIVQILKRVLTDEGYEVKATGKAKEALRLIEGGEYALILLDIKLPDMSGIELYQHLDKTAKPSAQKIIFLTGDVMGADTMDFFSRTGVACITKPFEIEQLKKEVKSKLTPGG